MLSGSRSRLASCSTPHLLLLAVGAAAPSLGLLGAACQSRAIGIVYVGEDAGEASGGTTGIAGSSGGGGDGAGGNGGSAGERDAAVDGATDGSADAETDADATLPDADIPDGDIPPGEHCEPVADWPEDLAAEELALFEAVNDQRSLGGSCDGTKYKPTPPLVLQPILRCSARLHTKDMVERDYFSLFNPEGEDPQDRMRAAGWQHPMWGENIFHDNDSPTSVVSKWIAAGGDQCRNIIDARHGSIGVGRFGNKWTIDMGTVDGDQPQDAGLTDGD